MNKKKDTLLMLDDPENPFGANIWVEEKQSALNIVSEEGTWYDWNTPLTSQFLPKQSPELAKRQQTGFQ